MSTSSRPPARARRRRGSLRADLILDAAEYVAAKDGFAALTLRAVAAHLDAAPMALYRYFATKEDLVNALLDRVLGRFEPPEMSGDWVEDVRRFAHAHRRLLVRHPWALISFFSHPSPGTNATRIGEVALEILSRTGFDNDAIVATFGGLLALNYGWTAFASARDMEPAFAAEQVRAAMAALPASTFPYTAAVAVEMATYGNDAHYALVLEQLLAGLQAVARG